MSEAAPSTTLGALETPYATARPRPRSRGWLYVVVAGVALLGGYVALHQTGWLSRWMGSGASDASVFVVQPSDLQIILTEDGELKAQQSIEIRNEVEGASTILFIVPESTRVKKGDLLVELASDELKERLEQEQLSLSTTRAAYEAAVQDLEITRNENASKLKKCTIDRDVAELELRQYLEGDFEKQLKEAEINIQQTKLEIDRKKDELEKNQNLYERKFVTLSKIEQLQFELEKLKMTLDKHELSKVILHNYDRPKVEKQKRSALEQAEQEYERELKRCESRERQALAKSEEQKGTLAMRERRVGRLQELLGKTRIIAPIDGVIQYPTEGGWRGDDVILAVGQKVYEGQTLMILPNTSQMMVSTRVHEADRHKLSEGMYVQVRVPAVPGRVFTGKIQKIAPFADSANRWFNPNLKEHTTEIMLDETDAPVSPGDSADIKIFVDQLANVLAVPVQCVFARGTRNFVFLEESGSAKLVEVKLGQASTNMVEIREGLTPGQRVMMIADEKLLAMLPPANTGTLDMPAVPQPGPGARPGGGQGGAPAGGQRPGGRGGRGGGDRAVKPGAPAGSAVAAKPADENGTASSDGSTDTDTTASVAEANAADTAEKPADAPAKSDQPAETGPAETKKQENGGH